jgi:2-succinyl-5-enolpyruvyl-6-hydroxy-3-cyclohexene-1-carboxylate synthase
MSKLILITRVGSGMLDRAVLSALNSEDDVRVIVIKPELIDNDPPFVIRARDSADRNHLFKIKRSDKNRGPQAKKKWPNSTKYGKHGQKKVTSPNAYKGRRK